SFLFGIDICFLLLLTYTYLLYRCAALSIVVAVCQRSIFLCPGEAFFPKASAKVRRLFQLTKYFKEKVRNNCGLGMILPNYSTISTANGTKTW
ncbi:MAG: hypothetical protein MJZ36_10845, partial [Bacteroidaceae bacterium]|nr:hypothetical protein [Bacteroidaceae bacterium]